MDEIKALTEIDYVFLFVSIVGLLLGAKGLVALMEYWITKTGLETKWSKKKKEEHELLLANAQAIKDLAELHKKDNDTSNEHDEKLHEELSSFMTEVRTEIKMFAENRVHDKEQSLEIQKELKDSIKTITEKNRSRDVQIDSLIVAQKEMLAEKINSKYKYYLSIDGIPEDEYDEFVSLHAAYKKVGGNHHGDSKFEYCINHLKVIPVETKLVIKDE